MRVAIYNQMFALDGRSFWSNLLGHLAVHYQSDINQIVRRTDIIRTIEIVSKSSSDIIGICEVLEGQFEALKHELGKMGYVYSVFSRGHKLSHYNLYIGVALFSKLPFTSVSLPVWPMENKIGGGGGIVSAFVPSLNTTVFCCHLSLPSKKYFSEQMEFISEQTKKTGGKVILLGDFNLEYQKIKIYFPNLDLMSDEINTCSVTPIMNWFFSKDCDHILSRGLKCGGIGENTGFSDHKLIYCDLS